MITIQMSEEDYLAGLKGYKNHLHDIIVLSKGDKSLTHLDICKKLEGAWRSQVSWKASPLGKTFYEFAFSLLEDLRGILGVGSWNLSVGILRVFVYSKDFALATMNMTKAQC